MALPDIILGKNKVLIVQSESGLNIYQENNSYINGTIEQISDLEDTYSVNDLVYFNANEATRFKFDNDTYYVVETDKIFYKENFIAP